MSSSSTDPHRWTVRGFWLSFWLGAATLVFGTLGVLKYEQQHHQDPAHELGAVYAALQMLILHTPHFEKGANAWLEAGRWCGVAFFSLTTANLVWRRLRRGEHLIWLTRMKDHYVICGLGQKGSEILQSLFCRDPRAKAIVIDPNPDAQSAQVLQGRRVVLLQSDATQPTSLQRARVALARQIIIVTPADDTNVAAAVAVRTQLAGRTTSRIPCHVHLSDIDLRETLEQWDESGHLPKSGCQMHFFDVFDNEARRVLCEHPLDGEGIAPNSSERVHVGILGFGRMARSLALRAVKMGHFANGQPIRVSVVTRDATMERERFLFRYPALADDSSARELLGMMEFHAGEAESLTTRELLLHWASEPDTRLHLYVCLDDDARAVEVAIRLRTILAEHGSRSLHVRIRSRGSLATMLEYSSAGNARLVPFGMVEDSCGDEAYLRQHNEDLARAIHHQFVKARLADSDRRPETDPALRDWDNLREDLRESNRQQADHLPLKMRAIGCEVVPISDPRPPLTRFSPEEIEWMSPMEHSRWNAERLLAGWRQGSPSNKDLRINENIVPWNRLSPNVQHYDRDTVANIPNLLAQDAVQRKVVRKAASK